MADERRDLHTDTRVVHEGEGQSAEAAPVTSPLYDATTFVFDSAAEIEAYNDGRSRRYLYSRYENPTVGATERKLAALEGAERALLFSSGMAATATTIMGLVGAGDEVVCTAAIYGGTLRLLTDLLPRFGVAARFVETTDAQAIASAIGPRTRLVWWESPVNPTLRCVDISAVAQTCRQRQPGCIALGLGGDVEINCGLQSFTRAGQLREASRRSKQRDCEHNPHNMNRFHRIPPLIIRANFK